MKNNSQNQKIPKVIKYRIAESSWANNRRFIPPDICIPARDNIPADICIPARDSIPADICIPDRDSIPADICAPSPDDQTFLDSIFFSQSSRESFRSFPDKYPPSLPNSLYCSTFNYSPSPYSASSPSYSKWSNLSSRNFSNSQAPSVSTSSTHQNCLHILSEFEPRDRACDKHQNCVHIPSDTTQKRDSLSFNDYTNPKITSYNSSKKFPSPSPFIKDDTRKLVLLLLKPLPEKICV